VRKPSVKNVGPWNDVPKLAVKLAAERTSGFIEYATVFNKPITSVTNSAYLQGFVDCFEVMKERMEAQNGTHH
jgi:hypothetical protein